MKKQKPIITAIICELNPMHTGHTYLIEQAKKQTNATYMVGIMSGNFSQRSEPCILNKYLRAKIAVHNGFDLMLNLPTAFCTNNAEVFALSAIKILNNLKTVNYLAFGVETLNEKAFYTLSNFMLNEPEEFKTILKQNLKSGLSHNNAYIKTLKENPHFFDKSLQDDIIKILDRPNNVLALEYIKALIKTNSKIKPIFIYRKNDYNSINIENNFASATSLRNKIFENKLCEIKKFLPQNSVKFFEENLQKNNAKNLEKSEQYFNQKIDKNSSEILTENFNKNYQIPLNLKMLILYKIKSSNLSYLKSIYGVCEGLENKLKNQSQTTNSFDEFYTSLQTKRYKQNKINSIILNVLLDIDKKTIAKLYTIKNNIFVKILAISPKKHEILGKINTKNLILRKSDADKKTFDNFNKKLFEIENNANIVYNLIYNTHLYENDLYNKMES